MSGTSMDGVDGVLASFDRQPTASPRWPRRIAFPG
jgi:1,6-anhydro-N-acetylmuramate kinase